MTSDCYWPAWLFRRGQRNLSPRLHISSSVNMGISYSIFSLFFTGEIFKKISHSINFYAQLNRVSDSESKISQGRCWRNTNVAEIKIFFAVFIYMKLHNSNRTNLYWRNDLDQGPIYMSQRYMVMTRWQQLKRYLHIFDSRDRNPSLKLPKSVEQLQKKK